MGFFNVTCLMNLSCALISNFDCEHFKIVFILEYYSIGDMNGNKRTINHFICLF